MIIECRRFRLVPFTLEFIDALLGRDVAAAEGALDVRIPPFPLTDADERFLSFRRGDLQRDPESSDWLAKAMVLPNRTMAGHIGFHSPPDDDRMVEMGYTVFEEYRRRGFASEAIAGMMAWAGDNGARRFRLAIAPDNEPSLALAAKLGFVHVGEQMDEYDGRELIFELDAM